jgi:hypothetical protein
MIQKKCWLLWLAIPALLLQPARAQDLSPDKVADIAQAYYESMETLRFRSHTIWPNDDARKLDPTLFGPGDLVTQEFAMAKGLRYFGASTQKDGRIVSDTHLYQTGEESCAIHSGGPDTLAMVSITRGNGFVPPTILRGLYDTEGVALHVLLRASSTTNLGRREVDGVSCYAVETVGDSGSVTWFLDPERDFLCRKKAYFVRGEASSEWRVTAFRRVGQRWFPDKVTDDTRVHVAGRTVIHVSRTEVDDVQINQPIDPGQFQPEIPDGAQVRDTRGGEPREYTQGGTEALRRMLDRQRAGSTGLEANAESRIVVERPFNWVAWVAGCAAILSGALLIYAARVRLARR